MGDVVTREELPYVIAEEELPYGGIAHKFEGYRYGDVDVSFFLVESPPGGGAVLHTHPYEEVFVTPGGEATFTVGDATVEVGAGQIVVAPAGVPHKFVNSGSGPLRQAALHPRATTRHSTTPTGTPAQH